MDTVTLFVVYSCWPVISRAKNYFTDPTDAGHSRSMFAARCTEDPGEHLIIKDVKV